MHKAYILNPHNDDGVIAIGGIIIQLLERDWKIGYIQFTDGRHGGEMDPEELKKIRSREGEEERKFLGIKEFYNFDIEDGKLEEYKDDKSIIEEVAKIVKNANVVFLPNKAEAHPDHRATYEIGHKALLFAKKPLEVHYIVWFFPFYSYNPGRYEKILKINMDDQVFEKKLKAIRRHKSQVERGRYDKNSEMCE